MADEYLRDYSSVSAIGGAFKGFADAYNQGIDRNNKQQELDARMAAEKTKMDREIAQTAIENRRQDYKEKQDQLTAEVSLRAQGKMRDEQGNIVDAPLTQREMETRDMGYAEKGMVVPTRDATGKIIKSGWDPNSPQILGAKAKQTTAGAAVERADASRVAAGAKSTKADQKRWDDLANDLDSNRPRAGQLGKIQGVINASDRIHAIFQQFPDGNIPKTQSVELGTAVAGLISGGSPQSQQQIHEIVPSSASGSAADIVGWFTNNPTGREQQQFMKVLQDTSERERAVAQKQLLEAQRSRLVKYEELKANDPDHWNRVLTKYHVTEEDQPEQAPSVGAVAPQAAPVAAQPGGLVAPRGLVSPPGLLSRAVGKLGSFFQGTSAGADTLPANDDLNAQLGKMSKEELKSWLAKHGK